MARQMRTKDELYSEYIRSALFGENIKRRALNLIKNDLTQLCGSDSADIIKDLDSQLVAIKEIGEKAVALAKSGVAADSVELENLLVEAKNIGSDAARQYVLMTFQDAPANEAKVPPKTEPPKTANKPAPKEKQNAIRGEDFFTGNAFQPVLPKPDGTFPSDWTKCKYGNEPTDFGQLMYKYCYCGLWRGGPSQQDEIKKILFDIRRLYSDEERIDNAIKVAEAWLKKAKPAFVHAMKRESDTPEQMQEINQIGGPLSNYIEKQRANQRQRSQKSGAIMSHSTMIATPSTPAPAKTNVSNVPQMSKDSRNIARFSSHPNDIFNLKPAKEWNLYIDESGDDNAFETKGSGVIAGALSCVANPLPPQPQLHASTDATEAKLTAGDKVIETLINHKQCGVLAIPTSAYASAQGWGSLIASFIDLVLRLLPLPQGKEKVKLNIFVEARSPYDKEVDFNFMRDACRYNLMHVFPERANRISFDITTMGKNDDHNAYPDLIAHTCATWQKNPLAKNRFAASGWDGTCFLDYPAAELRNLLEYFFSGRNLPAPEWDSLLKSADISQNGLLAAILKTIGTEAQGKLPLWKEYLDWTVAHLSSKAISLRKLHSQLSWLKTYQPAETELPPRIKLLWLTSKLAESNHLGEIEKQSPVGQEFMRLIEDLYEEDAPLTCWAVLHLAVQKTNAYQFEAAKKLVTDFSDIGSLLSKEPPFTRLLKTVVRKLTGDVAPNNYAPAAIPGLRYYGQLLSSCGQHEAFLGDNEKAIIYFKEAIKCFERLSENKFLDIDQTTAYLATAQMDLAPKSKDTVAVMEQYLGCGVKEAAAKLAASTEDKDKYHHHILLRYLVQSQDKDAIKAYLDAKAGWKVGDGHPWEMIEFYRALLLENPEESFKHISTAYKIARGESGATLRVIACIILGAAIYINSDFDKEKLKACISAAVAEVPDLGEKRVQALMKQIESPIPPLELARIVLPFNFR